MTISRHCIAARQKVIPFHADVEIFAAFSPRRRSGPGVAEQSQSRGITAFSAARVGSRSKIGLGAE
jgi:hypothetical protein